ncbi:MAG: transposase [Saprospiraceae bacterium]
MNPYAVPLLPGKTYHLFNHAVGNELLFRENKNYLYFLEKLKKYAPPVCKIYAYILMPNHFHLAASIRKREELLPLYKGNGEPTDEELAAFVIQQFSNMFNSYAKSHNKIYERRGALFIDYLRRKEVCHKAHLKNLISYVNCNGVHHRFCETPQDWFFTSYHTILTQSTTLLERDDVLRLFSGLENFIKTHQTFNPSFDDDLEF